MAAKKMSAKQQSGHARIRKNDYRANMKKPAPYGRTEDGQPYTKKGSTARGAEGPKRSMPRKKTTAKKRAR